MKTPAMDNIGCSHVSKAGWVGFDFPKKFTVYNATVTEIDTQREKEPFGHSWKL